MNNKKTQQPSSQPSHPHHEQQQQHETKKQSSTTVSFLVLLATLLSLLHDVAAVRTHTTTPTKNTATATTTTMTQVPSHHHHRTSSSVTSSNSSTSTATIETIRRRGGGGGGGFFKPDAVWDWLLVPLPPRPSVPSPSIAPLRYKNGSSISSPPPFAIDAGARIRGGSSPTIGGGEGGGGGGVDGSRTNTATTTTTITESTSVPSTSTTTTTTTTTTPTKSTTFRSSTHRSNKPPPPPSSPTSPSLPSSSTSSSSCYPLSIHSIQGHRPYMEDETYTNHDGTFVAVMDGHGGNAVSRYIRQNLYARYLQARSTHHHHHHHHHHPPPLHHSHSTPHHSEDYSTTTVRICEDALRDAFSTVDAEVQRISHWSYQGSTAVAVMIHETTTTTTTSTATQHDVVPGAPTTTTTTTSPPPPPSLPPQKKTYLITANVGDSRAVLAQNRIAIDLTTDHRPDHPEERKRIEALGGSVEWFGPRDPITKRPLVDDGNGGIDGGGGIKGEEEEEEDGAGDEGDERRKPQRKRRRRRRGVFRINGNLSLSRAIGDRAERPCVGSEVDVRSIELDWKKGEDDGEGEEHRRDGFVIVASDGVWDVFDSSQEVVDFCYEVLDEGGGSGNSLEDRKSDLGKRIVEEAERRGSMDNISAVVVWLS